MTRAPDQPAAPDLPDQPAAPDLPEQYPATPDLPDRSPADTCTADTPAAPDSTDFPDPDLTDSPDRSPADTPTADTPTADTQDVPESPAASGAPAAPDRVAALLAALGDDAAEVAATLRAEAIRGVRGGSLTHPISRWLTRHVPGLGASLGADEVQLFPRAPATGTFRHAAFVSLPPAVRAFADGFDDGRHPELELWMEPPDLVPTGHVDPADPLATGQAYRAVGVAAMPAVPAARSYHDQPPP